MEQVTNNVTVKIKKKEEQVGCDKQGSRWTEVGRFI
jgi:hypothetical protein